MPKTGPIPQDTARRLVHGYYAAVSFMDAQVGKMLKALQEEGLTENTVVILWGDHGWHLGDHGIWCKHTNYEMATRSALVMSAPGQKITGQACDKLVEFVDIYPTLAELCKLPKPADVEGYSFAPLLDDPKQKWKAAAFSQYPRSSKETGRVMGYAVRSDRYRYVEWRSATAPRWWHANCTIIKPIRKKIATSRAIRRTKASSKNWRNVCQQAGKRTRQRSNRKVLHFSEKLESPLHAEAIFRSK